MALNDVRSQCFALYYIADTNVDKNKNSVIKQHELKQTFKKDFYKVDYCN